MIDEFIINAIFCGIGIALISGLMGCFVVWKKMAYFGDSLGHSAVFGVGIGILLGANQDLAIIFTVISFAILFTYLQNKDFFSSDVILGILAHGALSIGIILLSISNNANFNLHALLFGDILAASEKQIYIIFVAAALIYCLIGYNWQALILNTISRDLAKSQNISNFKMDLLLTTIMALVVAISIKIIGALLITSMLIIPPSSAKRLVNNPKSMAVISTLIALLAVICGIALSYYFDIPSGPAIIMISFIIFILTNLTKKTN